MKILKFLCFFAVLFSFSPISYSFAEEKERMRVLTLDEAEDLIHEAPSADDAVTGTVSPESLDFYDIYARQLAFRESAKDLRASLEVRRESFEEPRLGVLENHRDVVPKVHAAETAAYLKETAGDDKKSKVRVPARKKQSKKQEILDVSDVQKQDLKEVPIPDAGDVAPKRKVVTTG